MVFGVKIMENTLKINDFLCFSDDFPGFSRITRVSDHQGFRSHRVSECLKSFYFVIWRKGVGGWVWAADF